MNSFTEVYVQLEAMGITAVPQYPRVQGSPGVGRQPDNTRTTVGRGLSNGLSAEHGGKHCSAVEFHWVENRRSFPGQQVARINKESVSIGVACRSHRPFVKLTCYRSVFELPARRHMSAVRTPFGRPSTSR